MITVTISNDIGAQEKKVCGGEAFLKCVCGLQEEIGGTNVPPQGLELMKLKAEGPRETQL